MSLASKEIISNLDFPHVITEHSIMSGEDESSVLFSYRAGHTAAKVKVLKGRATEEDEAIFAPVRKLASELSSADVLIIATPMWNFSLPYVLKQYIDIAVQPGINLYMDPEPDRKRHLVVISSSALAYGGNGQEEGPRDYLRPYLNDLFRMVGFDPVQTDVKIEGTSSKSREESVRLARTLAMSAAEDLNRSFAE